MSGSWCAGFSRSWMCWAAKILVGVYLGRFLVYSVCPAAGSGAGLEAQSILSTLHAVADWQLEHPSRHSSTDWTQGAGDAGMMALAGLPGGRRYEEAMLAMGRTNNWSPGPRRYHADDHAVGMTYCELFFKHQSPEMIKPLQVCFDGILAQPSRVALDFRVSGNQNRWSWCDSLFMSPPAWLRLHVATGDRKYLDFMNTEWWATTGYLYDKEEHLYFRDSTYFSRREANGKKVFWGRGNGWVMAGLCRVLQYFPKDHPDRSRYESLYKEMAAKILSLQQSDGLWRASLLDPASYPLKETSGSGFYCFALAWGINEGYLDRAATLPAVEKAWAALVGCVTPDGKLTHVQPIGADPKKFDPDATEVYGVGAFLLAGSEVYKLAQSVGLDSLIPGHPRLIMKESDLAALKKQHETDPVLQRIVSQALAEADRQIGKPALEHVIPDGLRLLATSRECLKRTVALGFAYRWTGDLKYARSGISNLLTVCAFKDWNPRHFLDTAELSCAVGIGYDWFYPVLTESERAAIRKGLIKNAFTPKADGFTDKQNNWNQVCNGGLIVGSLAIAETDPGYAKLIISRALRNLPNATRHYAPDGAWMEGPGYWEYATTYMAYAIAALDSSLGTNFRLDATPGLDRAGYFPIYTTGPGGNPLCFADVHFPKPENPGVKMPVARYNYPSLFWLARKYHNTDFSDAVHAVLAERGAQPLEAVWYVPPTLSQPRRDLDRFFDGPVPVMVMRSSWKDPSALWCGVKAGFNAVPHGHLDLGNFELESDGVRFALDLGSDDYNMPGYFGKQRYSYYRMNSESHNVPLIAGKGQLLDGVAKVLEVRTNCANPHVAIDLTSAYRDRADKVVRTVSMVDDRRAIEVRDAFELKQAGEILWGLTTDADITTHGDGSATLVRFGRKLSVRVLAPGQGRFEVRSAGQKPPENENKGCRRLILRVSAPKGSTAIKIRLQPEEGAH